MLRALSGRHLEPAARATPLLKEGHCPWQVQHPGLAERLGIDMAILMATAKMLGSVKGLQINETVAQFASNFYMQLDFRDEAENLRRFRRHFASGFWRAIVSFPTPVDDLVSQHVVVETFEVGESVADYLHKAGDSPKVTCRQAGWRGLWSCRDHTTLRTRMCMCMCMCRGSACACARAG